MKCIWENVSLQVSLKSPEAVVTLPIYIGNVAVNLTPSIPYPIAQGAPMPAMPSLSPAPIVPSAPPVEDDLEGELGAGGVDSEEIPTKSHSQQDPSGVPLTMSPGAFGLASGPVPPQSQQNVQSSDGSAPVFCLSTGATIPFFTDGNSTPVPTSCPLILPPEYSTWEYPHGEWFLRIILQTGLRWLPLFCKKSHKIHMKCFFLLVLFTFLLFLWLVNVHLINSISNLVAQ